MHDGTTTYEGVLDVVQKLKERGKEMVILSNSSKRQENAIKMLTKLGFDPVADFSQIITSGEVSYQLLSGSKSSPLTPPRPWSLLEDILKDSKKRRVFCFGSGDGDDGSGGGIGGGGGSGASVTGRAVHANCVSPLRHQTHHVCTPIGGPEGSLSHIYPLRVLSLSNMLADMVSGSSLSITHLAVFPMVVTPLWL